jgi:hypothetical protein
MPERCRSGQFVAVTTLIVSTGGTIDTVDLSLTDDLRPF